MKYIFITFKGSGLPVAYKLHQEGHEVIVGMIEDIKEYIPEEEAANITENPEVKEKRTSKYKGMLNILPADKVVKMIESIKNPHEFFIYFETNTLYRWADKVRNFGFEGNFPTKEDLMFEFDRQKAKNFVKENYPRLHVPEVKGFTTIAEALTFLKKTKDLWVVKAKTDELRTYVPDVRDPSFAKEQIGEMLNNFKEKYERRGFILEKFIPSVIELTPQKMYYDGVPLGTRINIENQFFGAGNLSIQTGCAEDLVFPIDMESRINKIAFPPIVDQMARAHKGLFIWDASLLIDKRDGKIYFGEFCSNRFAYNGSFTEYAQSPSINDHLEAIVHKTSPYTLGTVGTSIRIFNVTRDEQTDHVASNLLIDYKPEIKKDVWLWDVKQNERGKKLSVGHSWNLGVITGAGKSISEAVNKMYRNFDAFSFPGAYCRSKADFVSLDYPTSILNRLNYGMERGLYSIPFDVKVGTI